MHVCAAPAQFVLTQSSQAAVVSEHWPGGEHTDAHVWLSPHAR
jgi:hypothetical protein